MNTKPGTLYVAYRGSSVDGTWTSDADIYIYSDREWETEDWGAPRGWFNEEGGISIIDEDDESVATRLAEQCGLDGSLTECHLLIYAIRKYAACCEYLGIPTGDEWSAFSRDELDTADEADYDRLASTVGKVFGEASKDAQYAALNIA